MSNHIRVTRSSLALVPPTGNLERSFARSKIFVQNQVLPQNPRTCWQYWTRTNLYTGPGILLARSRRISSISNVTATVGSYRGHSRCWVITVSSQPYSLITYRRCSSIASHAIVTCYAAKRENAFSNIFFTSYTDDEVVLKKGFLSNYWTGFPWHS